MTKITYTKTPKPRTVVAGQELTFTWQGKRHAIRAPYSGEVVDVMLEGFSRKHLNAKLVYRRILFPTSHA